MGIHGIFGRSWALLDIKTLMLFNCFLLHMSTTKLPRIRSYFCRIDGDPLLKRLPLSRNRFEKIYLAFSMYDPDDAHTSGVSTHSNKEKFDLLHKVNF